MLGITDTVGSSSVSEREWVQCVFRDGNSGATSWGLRARVPRTTSPPRSAGFQGFLFFLFFVCVPRTSLPFCRMSRVPARRDPLQYASGRVSEGAISNAGRVTRKMRNATALARGKCGMRCHRTGTLTSQHSGTGTLLRRPQCVHAHHVGSEHLRAALGSYACWLPGRPGRLAALAAWLPGCLAA